MPYSRGNIRSRLLFVPCSGFAFVFGACLSLLQVLVMLVLNLDPVASKEILADRITKWVHSAVSDGYALAEGVVLPEGAIPAHET